MRLVCWLTSWLTCVVLCIGAASPARSQTTLAGVPNDAPATTWSARDWTRVEAWHFFEPPPGGGDNEYEYIANRLLLSARHSARRYDLNAALQYVHFALMH